jgi:phage major head subunit gpT-like protein
VDLNRENLDTIFRGLNKTFVGAYKHGEDASSDAIATTLSSSTASERFDWLGDDPEMREWIGPRRMHQFKSFRYEVFPRDWEITCRVQANDIADDRIGIYDLQAARGGEATRLLKPREICNALLNGTSQLCYDGQFFFDSDHPVGEDGDITTFTNMHGNSVGGTTADNASADHPWYLIDPSRVVKPIIVVERQKPVFQAFADYSNLHTFFHKEFLFGAHARLGTGYGLWQTCVRSTATLNITNLRLVRDLMATYTSDRKNEDGKRKNLGIRPTMLVVDDANYDAAVACVNSPTIASLTDPFAVANSNTANPVYKAFTIVRMSWLNP